MCATEVFPIPLVYVFTLCLFMQENKSVPPAWQGNMFRATVSRVTPDEPLCLHLRHAEQAAVLI